jgi:hypothetical protein
VYTSSVENLKNGDLLEELGVDRRIILKLILEKLSVDLVRLVQDTVQWRALVNTVMNLRVQ